MKELITKYLELKKTEASIKTELDLLKEQMTQILKDNSTNIYRCDIGQAKLLSFEKKQFSQEKAKELLGEKIEECYYKIKQEYVKVTSAEDIERLRGE